VSMSTHVLDASAGRPAAGVAVFVERLRGGLWNRQHLAATDDDGRITMPGENEPGTYRFTFRTGDYFAARGQECFYPEVSVTFAVTSPAEHYHVPLLLSPFAYSTYRGS
jgi:5-hydroxyisourate hydrolase